MDKVKNLKCLYQGDGILEEELVTDSQRNSILLSLFQGKVSMYAKSDPNPYYFHKIMGGNHFWV